MFEDSLHLPKAGYTLEDRECSGFYIYPGQLHRIPMEAGKKVFSFHINIQPQLLAGLMTRFPQLDTIMHGIHPHTSTRINNHPYHINAVCDMLIRKIITCCFEEKHAHPFLQRCITDILLNFTSQHNSAQEPFLFSSMLHSDTYHNLFTFVAEHPHQPHSPAALAYMYEMPLPELEHGFRQHFALTLSDYIHMTKMMLVWHLIQSGTFSLEEVTKVAGFKDKNTMLSQVRTFYGTDPTQL
jgi:AraC-like DNA-binding protein